MSEIGSWSLDSFYSLYAYVAMWKCPEKEAYDESSFLVFYKEGKLFLEVSSTLSSMSHQLELGHMATTVEIRGWECEYLAFPGSTLGQ